jgi:CelD/BcsL family acetyltransferase involved in cellulose biosynthesis
VSRPVVARTDAGSTATVASSSATLEPLHDEWRRLAEAHGNPYLTPEWYDACLRRGGDAAAVAVRSADGTLRGLLPLVRQGRGPVRVLRFPGDDLGDTFELLVARGEDPEAVARIAGRALAASPLRPDPLMLWYVDAEAPWLRGLSDGLGAVAVHRRGTLTRPWVDLSCGDWTEFLAGLKRTDRKETRRRERRALEAGAEYRLVEGPDEALAGMQELFRLHDLRWSEPGASSVATPEIRDLLSDFAAGAARHGWLRLWLVEMEGRPVAAELAWRIGARQLHFQGGWDPEHASLGLGLVAFGHALEEAIADGVAEADLGIGESDYKRRFARDERVVSQLAIVRRRHPARAAIAAAFGARRALASLPDERRAQVRRLLRRG